MTRLQLHQLDNMMLLRLLRLCLHETHVPDISTPILIAGIEPAQQASIAHLLPTKRIPAAVLMPIVERPAGLSVLFTERASHLKHHAGQISFPGGRIEETDENPLAAALRETREEIGLMREHIDVIGYLQPHLIFTGYWVIPAIALVQPEFELKLDSSEVADVFEAPLAYFLNPAHHQVRERHIGDITTLVYDLPYGDRHIWGATAGILMNLYRMLNAAY